MADTLFAAWLIARKDLAIEFRTRSAFLSAVVFALLGLVIFYYSWDPTAVAVTDLAPGVLWIVFTFSGLLGLHRSFAGWINHQFDRFRAFYTRTLGRTLMYRPVVLTLWVIVALLIAPF